MSFDTIRDALPVTGKTVVDVTCDDWADVVDAQPDPAERKSKVYLHFNDGSTLAFWIGIDEESGFEYDGHPEDQQAA